MGYKKTVIQTRWYTDPIGIVERSSASLSDPSAQTPPNEAAARRKTTACRSKYCCRCCKEPFNRLLLALFITIGWLLDSRLFMSTCVPCNPHVPYPKPSNALYIHYMCVCIYIYVYVIYLLICLYVYLLRIPNLSN